MIQSKFGKNDVEVRPARAEDKAAVLAFCEQTWEHQEDYIYRVWDKWLADERGRIFVAVVDGLPVAMQRVVLMSDDEAWWEGLRVDPNYRGRGLVSVLRSPMEQYLLTQNIRVLRSCLSSDNTIMKGIMARRGYEKVGSYAPYVAEVLPSLPSQLVQLDSSDCDSVGRFVTSSNVFEQKRCLYINRGAKWQELTLKQLKTRLNQGKVWGLKQNHQLRSMAIESYLEGSNQKFWIGYVNGTTENLPILMLELRNLAHHKGYQSIGGIFPICDLVLKSLEVADYRRITKEEYWVYEWQNDST